jgi:hypothetical protein
MNSKRGWDSDLFWRDICRATLIAWFRSGAKCIETNCLPTGNMLGGKNRSTGLIRLNEEGVTMLIGNPKSLIPSAATHTSSLQSM